MEQISGFFKRPENRDYLCYPVVIAAYLILMPLSAFGMLSSTVQGYLVPVCYWIVMALSLNLTVGVMGDLSLGHAGFMSLGAFTGVIVSQSLLTVLPNPVLRLIVSMLAGALVAALSGFLIGLPVLRLRGDYLAIVTLAFGEIIKDLITCMTVWKDKTGVHFEFDLKSGASSAASMIPADEKMMIVNGAQGTDSVSIISNFTAGFILILFTLFVILNFVRSRTGRAVLAIRDNRIAAESMGVNVMKYKMIAFVISTTLAGLAGVLYGLNYASMSSAKFKFDTSILVLVFVVLGGLGNMLGAMIAATVLYILPEALRGLQDYRMLIYSVLLILIMLGRNSPQMKNLLMKIIPTKKKDPDDPSAPEAGAGPAAEEGV